MRSYNTSMSPYILMALAAMMGFGVTAIIYKLAAGSIDPIAFTILIYVFAILTLLPFWFWMGQVVTKKGVGYAALAGIIAGFSMVAYVASIHLGKVSIAATLRSLSFVVATLLAVFFLGEKLTGVQVLGITSATIAAILLSM